MFMLESSPFFYTSYWTDRAWQTGFLMEKDKKMRKIMIGCSGLGVSLTAAKSQYSMTWLSAEYCHILIILGVVGTFMTSLTANENTESAEIAPDQNEIVQKKISDSNKKPDDKKNNNNIIPDGINAPIQ